MAFIFTWKQEERSSVETQAGEREQEVCVERNEGLKQPCVEERDGQGSSEWAVFQAWQEQKS